MSWFLVILFLILSFGTLSEASHNKKLPSAVVVGTVYCDTCFQQDFSMGSHIISGASVAVECKDGNESSKPTRFRKEVKTDEHGEFRVQLPFSVSKHVKRIKRCTVKLVSSSEPYCAVTSAANSSSLRLKSRKQGLQIFSAGFFSFKPLKQPNLCNKKPSVQNAMTYSFPKHIDPSFPPPLQDPSTPGGLPILPPLPGLPDLPPLPQLPLLPPLPGITVPLSPPVPNPKPYNAHVSDQKVVDPQNLIFPPNPLFPPPVVPNPFQPPPLIPNPLQPPGQSPLVPDPFQPPSPTPLIPNPLQPPPSSVSSPPVFPFPFPPLIPPSSSPGSPPASSSKYASP